MVRVLLFILVVLNFAVFAQTSAGEREQISKATKFEEFGAAPHSILRHTLDLFLVKLHDNPNLRGYILNYGTDNDAPKREKSVKYHLSLRRFPVSRITMLKAGVRDEFNTELWLAPEGSLPEPLLLTRKIGEFNIFRQNAAARAKLLKFETTLRGNLFEIDTMYVAFWSRNVSELKRLEIFVRKTLFGNCRDCYGFGRRILFANAGRAKTPKVEFWIVPAGQELPKLNPEN